MMTAERAGTILAAMTWQDLQAFEACRAACLTSPQALARRCGVDLPEAMRRLDRLRDMGLVAPANDFFAMTVKGAELRDFREERGLRI